MSGIIPCSHWRAGHMPALGECAIGAYKEPGYAICLDHCEKYDGPKRAELTISASSCCGPQVVKWLGVRWYGVPLPKRWWALLHGRRFHWTGCGCPVKTKALWIALAASWKYWRTA